MQATNVKLWVELGEEPATTDYGGMLIGGREALVERPQGKTCYGLYCSPDGEQVYALVGDGRAYEFSRRGVRGVCLPSLEGLYPLSPAQMVELRDVYDEAGEYLYTATRPSPTLRQRTFPCPIEEALVARYALIPDEVQERMAGLAVYGVSPWR